MGDKDFHAGESSDGISSSYKTVMWAFMSLLLLLLVVSVVLNYLICRHFRSAWNDAMIGGKVVHTTRYDWGNLSNIYFFKERSFVTGVVQARQK